MTTATETTDSEPRTTSSRENRRFEVMAVVPPGGLLRRFLTTQRHFLGLLLGSIVAWVRDRPPHRRRGLLFQLSRPVALLARLFVKGKIVRQPFPAQLRRRLELLGPTYIKLGQILSLREDILPTAITNELKNLLDHLPVIPFEDFLERVGAELDRPVDEVFDWIEPEALGSASIAQTHRARLKNGEQVILKVVKPGIPETLERDAKLIWLLGRTLQLFFSRFQPKKVLDEFVDYTLREVDLRLEADNAETFAANFRDQPDVVFPKIHREASSRYVLTMEFLDGVKPSAAAAARLLDEENDRLIDLGAGSIIRMLYKDGFFHADLHPGNLLVLPGPRLGFIDLGMVGRFGDQLRRTLLYYYYSLVIGDSESAARYLASVAQPAAGADPEGFRREVAEICRRWHKAATFHGFSLGQLILQSVGKGASFRMYFPVETVLMVKAIITFEGVGQILKPDFDVAAVSQSHARQIFLQQFSPLRLARESLRGAPELVEAIVRSPLLVTEGIRFFEQQTSRAPENPFAGLRGTIFGGFCLLAGALMAATGAPWYWPTSLITAGVLLAVRRGK